MPTDKVDQSALSEGNDSATEDWVTFHLRSDHADELWDFLHKALGDAQQVHEPTYDKINSLIKALKVNAERSTIPKPPMPSVEVSQDHPF